ncbi:MAG TPA: fasciclin domain-containing protein [Lacipirellulaceae bacterium]|nr:fasciclin domain-containing protein [Lacipirellulaceae bacterium]
MKLHLQCATAIAVALAPLSVQGEPCPLTQATTRRHVAAVQPTIVAAAAGNKDFSTLVAAVKAAGLVETLSGKGPFTVFAPTNEAFAKLPQGTVENLLKPENKSQLVALLTYHVVAGNVESDAAMKLAEAESVQGSVIPLKVKDGDLYVAGARVVKADLQCSNGVIHVIDSVIMPPAPQGAGEPTADIVATASSIEDFSTLVAAVKAAGLVETLQGAGPFTVFAPTNEAFAALPAGTVESLLKPENKDKLVAILTYHVVPGRVMAADAAKLSAAETVQGGKLAIKAGPAGVSIDKAKVLKADVACANGVIHVIDSVLMPQ